MTTEKRHFNQGNSTEFSMDTGIGREKLREMTRFADCPFVLWVGKRRMIKRELFDEYIEKMYEI